MWRLTVLFCLLYHGHISSQPVTGESVRQIRQLDFGECCPCPTPGQGLAAQVSSIPNGDFVIARARDIDDSDSEGSSSIIFPVLNRSDGNYVRPAEKKEDLKPLLHPEVDLASSVLQTLREATDEEYQDALTRDAARNRAAEAEESLFGDTLPEASNGNIVTIIVNPKHSDNLDDGIADKTPNQEPPCINAPLESVSTNTDQIRAAHEPPSLLHKIFGLPRISKPAGLLQNDLLDMDNGASNVQESVVHVDNDQVTNKGALGLRKYGPFIKLDKNLRDKSSIDMSSNVPSMTSNIDVGTSVKKVPDSKFPSLKNKWKDLVSNRAVLDSKDTTNSLPLMPKMKFNNPLLKLKGENREDLSLLPSNIHEQAKESFFKTKSRLDNIFQNTAPVGLKNLLKLKDVEFVPLKDLVPKSTDRSTTNRRELGWPDIFKKRGTVISSTKDKNAINLARSMEIIEKIPKSLDAVVSMSDADNCVNEAFNTSKINGEDIEANIASIEVADAALSPSEIEEIVSDMNNEFADNSQSNELPGNTDCNITLSDTETGLPQSMESSIESEAQTNNDNEFNFQTSEESIPINTNVADDPEFELVSNDEDCVSNNADDADSITDSSNNTYNVLIANDTALVNFDNLVNENTVTEEDLNQELPVSDYSKTLDVNPSKLNKPLSLDDTLSSVREKIAKHLKNLKTRSKSSKIPDSRTSSLIMENKESSPMADEKVDSDCQNEELIQVTTLKPDVCNNDLKIETESDDDKVSMQDLQKMSDEMLQKEQERERSKTLNEPTREVTDAKVPIEVNSAENGNIDLERSANTRNEVIMDPTNTDDIVNENDNDLKNTCKSDFKSPKQSFEQKPDANIEASEVVINRIPQSELSAYTRNDVIMGPTNIDDIVNENNLKNTCKSDFKSAKQSLEQDPDANVEASDVVINRIPQSGQSAYTRNDVITDPTNIDDIVNENDNDLKNICKSDFKSPKHSFEQEPDANVEASEVVIDRIPQSNNVFTLPLLPNKVVQPNENDFSLNIPLPNIEDIKLPPLPTLDEIKLGFDNLFDKPERDVEENSLSEAASMIGPSNILAPIMSTDASVKHFQSMLPPLGLENLDLDILQLNPQSNLFSNTPKLDLGSLRTKLPLPDLRLKPLKLQSVFGDNSGLLSLGQSNPWETIPSLDDFETRVKANTQKIAKTLRKPGTLRHSLKSSQGIGDLSDTKKSLKRMQNTLESKLRGATIKPVNLQSNDLLEVISRNHEDINDKLRALHIDFNDRLESMRNNFFDTSIFGSGESRNTKSFNTFSTKNKDEKLSQKISEALSNRRESKKTLKPQRLVKHKESRTGSSHGLQNKFKMPTAASVPVPRTVEVPELKATFTKSPGLEVQRASGINPIFQNIESSQPKESTLALWRQASKKLPITNTRLGKTISPVKDNKIKLSFSTTPRPSLTTKLQSRKLTTPSSLSLANNLGKNTGILGKRQDHKGSPSEMKHSIVSPPIYSRLDPNSLENYGLESESRQTNTLTSSKLGGKENLEQPKMNKDLESRFQVSESPFLSKVREAVKARMLKVNSPVKFKQNTQSVSRLRSDNGVLNSNTDMARSASTNIDVIDDETLKENVSYKCTMVCTKE